MARKTPAPMDTSFKPLGKWWCLTLTAMTPGKLLCLQHVLEANFGDKEAPKRPSRPGPKFVQGPIGHPSYVVLTGLTAGALRTLKGALTDYQEAFIKHMEETRAKQALEKQNTDLGRVGAQVLYRTLPERHMLVDEFMDFLQHLVEPEATPDPSEGPHMLFQVLKLSESPPGLIS